MHIFKEYLLVLYSLRKFIGVFLHSRIYELYLLSFAVNLDLSLLMHLSILSPRWIRQQNNPNPRELDRAPRHGMGKFDTFSRSSKINYITYLMAHPRHWTQNFCQWVKFVNGFSKLSNSSWVSPPLWGLILTGA